VGLGAAILCHDSAHPHAASALVLGTWWKSHSLRLVLLGLVIWGVVLQSANVVSSYHYRLRYAENQGWLLNDDFIWNPRRNQVPDILGSEVRNVTVMTGELEPVIAKPSDSIGVRAANTLNHWAVPRLSDRRTSMDDHQHCPGQWGLAGGLRAEVAAQPAVRGRRLRTMGGTSSASMSVGTCGHRHLAVVSVRRSDRSAARPACLSVGQELAGLSASGLCSSSG